MNDSDLQIEDLLSSPAGKEKKKKVDGKAKGDRTERGLCKLFTSHFGEEFTKAPFSGARTSQVQNLPEHAKMSMTGDLCVPEKFGWVVECKGGYESDIDLGNVIDGGGSPRLESFFSQSEGDAASCGRKPLVCWKRNRRPWIAAVRSCDLGDLEQSFSSKLDYNGWVLVGLEKLLAITDRSFWFKD